MRLPRPRSRSTSTHFIGLFSVAAFLFAGVVWSGSKAHAVELSPAEAKSHEVEQADADRVALLGRLQLAGIGSRRAGPPRMRVAKPPAAAPTLDEQKLALARYMTAVGTDSVETAVPSRAPSWPLRSWRTTGSRSPPATEMWHRAVSIRGC